MVMEQMKWGYYLNNSEKLYQKVKGVFKNSKRILDPTLKFKRIQVFKYSSIQVFKYSSIQVFKYSSV